MLDIKRISNFTCEGKCSGCGNCCTDFLPMSHKEVKKIKGYLKEHPEIKEQVYETEEGLHLTCAFRDNENKKCLIYPVRPLICRTFLCSKKESSLLELRDSIHSKSYYNRIDKNGISHFVSTHALFFDNKDWEGQVLYLLADKDIEKLNKLLTKTHFKYIIEEKEN